MNQSSVYFQNQDLLVYVKNGDTGMVMKKIQSTLETFMMKNMEGISVLQWPTFSHFSA